MIQVKGESHSHRRILPSPVSSSKDISILFLNGDGNGDGEVRQAVHEDTSIGGFAFSVGVKFRKVHLTTVQQLKAVFPFTHTMLHLQ